MKIVVFVSQTLDTEARVAVSSSGDSVDTEDVKWILNPYDDFAVEEAIQTKEKLGGEVIIVSAGPARVIEAIRQALRAQGVRRDGSAALDLCNVACGRYESFWEFGLNPWDMAAGTLILEEAGGKVTDLKGGKFSIYDGRLVASNSLIHNEMLELLAPYF